MDFYLLFPLFACAVCAGVAARTWGQEPDNAQVWPIGGLSAVVSFWAATEVLWNVSTTADAAVIWMRASGIATILIGPVAMHALVVTAEPMTDTVKRQLLCLYALGGALVVAALTTNWWVPAAVDTWWGWSPVVGPGIFVQYAFLMTCIGAGFVRVDRAAARSLEQTHATAMAVSSLAPIVIASLTDVVLPMVGYHELPRLGTTSLAIMALYHTYLSYNHDYSWTTRHGVTAQIFRAMPDGIVALTADGLIRSANIRFAEFVGVEPDDLIGAEMSRFLDHPIVLQEHAHHGVDCELTTDAGQAVEVSVSASSRRADGGTSVKILVIRDMREIAALRSRLMISGRMAAVGELAAGIAHELNNPIAYVRSNLAVLRENSGVLAKELRTLPNWCALEDIANDCDEIIDESLEGIDRAAAIVRDVREFSHGGGGSFGSTDVRALIEKSIRVARIHIRKSIEIACHLPDIPTIDAHEQRLSQVLVNLLVNAAHAIEDSGTISVSVSSNVGMVSICVQDDGSGIAPEHLDRIFDPFFTTKPVGVGTGLGLALAFGIVEEHGGTIDVESTLGLGTAFRISLPIEHAAA